MRGLLLFCFQLLTFSLFAQADTVKPVETEHKTSFEQYQLVIIAVVGLALLMAFRYWFRRMRQKQRGE